MSSSDSSSPPADAASAPRAAPTAAPRRIDWRQSTVTGRGVRCRRGKRGVKLGGQTRRGRPGRPNGIGHSMSPPGGMGAGGATAVTDTSQTTPGSTKVPGGQQRRGCHGGHPHGLDLRPTGAERHVDQPHDEPCRLHVRTEGEGRKQVAEAIVLQGGRRPACLNENYPNWFL